MRKYTHPVQSVSLALIVLGIALIETSPGIAQTLDNAIVEQDKAYLADIGNIGSRYASTQTFYVTIISALIAAFSFKEMNRPIEDFLSPVSMVLFSFVVIICYLWWDTIQFYHDLFGAKLKVLQEIEMSNQRLFPIFGHEHSPDRGLTARESLVAIAMGLLAMLVAAAAGVFQLVW